MESVESDLNHYERSPRPFKLVPSGKLLRRYSPANSFSRATLKAKMLGGSKFLFPVYGKIAGRRASKCAYSQSNTFETSKALTIMSYKSKKDLMRSHLPFDSGLSSAEEENKVTKMTLSKNAVCDLKLKRCNGHILHDQ